MIKYGDLVQLKHAKEIGIVIDDLESENNFQLININNEYSYRKILLFTENVPKIDFIPNCNVILISSATKEKNDTKI